MLGQPRPGGENEVGKVKGRFAGTGLCGPKDLEVEIVGARLELVMEQVMQTRDWRKCHDWETGQEGERQKNHRANPILARWAERRPRFAGDRGKALLQTP